MKDDGSSENESDLTALAASGKKSPKTGKQRPALRSLQGNWPAVPIPLERPRITLGRAFEADIRVNDSRASRLHSRITVEADPVSGNLVVRLVDLGSTNGTILNGEAISEAILCDGDEIVIGDHAFCFEMLEEVEGEFQVPICRLISHDDLTGLLTSKSFFSELRREVARAQAESHPFCVLMMSLDRYNELQESIGHGAAGTVLQNAGRLLKEALRAGDVASRFSSAEFAAFLLDANFAQGLVAAERVRAAIEQHQFEVPQPDSPEISQTLNMTVSIGVAAFPDDATDPIHLVELADSALYRATQTGRNCICSYRPSLAATEGPLPPRRM